MSSPAGSSPNLRNCGYRVIEAADTDEALNVLQHAEMRVYMVLCGVIEPDRAAGFAVAQWVRAHQPDTEMILAGTHARAASAAGDLCDAGPMLARPYEP
ncbi:MAG TPA: hypothetical protein VKW08_18620 [Xanthobacteraceae bacterium]|nr:hypothetical protein [Xanthobacteraceae bacterium]